jgi:hypothetical protein
MGFRYWMSAAVLVTALLLMVDAAAAFDDTIYPDRKDNGVAPAIRP